MSASKRTLLLGSIALSVAIALLLTGDMSAASPAIRGVPGSSKPESTINGRYCSATNIYLLEHVIVEQALYERKGNTWTCLDGSKVIPYSAVNDDYCDCADASDEPGKSFSLSPRFLTVFRRII